MPVSMAQGSVGCSQRQVQVSCCGGGFAGVLRMVQRLVCSGAEFCLWLAGFIGSDTGA